ncbi:unnamed protein product [Phaedon cochleariae]|uniref:RING-type domain-containing protein n=1 Tax=Phaedon cochleariae TaxID=80249 RepID=A0A9P0GVJ6_PHACE|nr:unnamed protein product [Phaedon cochleariae]
MSRRRNPRRSAAFFTSRNVSIGPESNSSDLSDASDGDFNLLEILLNLHRTRNAQKTRKPRKPKKSTTAAHGGTSSMGGRGGTSSGRGSKTQGRGARSRGRGIASQTLTSTQVGSQVGHSSCGSTPLDWESDIEVIEEDVKAIHQKDIENRVNTFFKSGNLMSDDEDDDLGLAKIPDKQPPKEPKEFYLLSDSDDEQPTVKDSVTCPQTVESQPNPVEIISINNDNDELMDIVDKILDCDDVPLEARLEVTNQPDKSWTEYKSKTEEILGSVNALLGELEEPKEKKEKVVQKSPEKSKPSCPICLEMLGGDVVAASTMCGHIFCHDCIKKVAQTSKTCPTCRKRVNLKQIHPLYL